MKTITDFELRDHGIEHSQYFQGCGVAYTEYTDVATGIGNDASEAFDDALEQLAQMDWDVQDLDKRQKELCKGLGRRKVSARMEDMYYYVSIRVR